MLVNIYNISFCLRLLMSVTGSPMSMYDFYMYLKHIEHSPENLEFYVWYVKTGLLHASITKMDVGSRIMKQAV